MHQLFRLKAGETSGIINTGFSLEIVKVTGTPDGKVQASHIVFDFKPLEDYLKPLRDQQKPSNYIKL
jgi:parvulin-like peptidyl-prolyl isomerase